MCVCMYVGMKVCMYVCRYEGMYVCMYVGMKVCMYVGMRVCMYVCRHVCRYEGIEKEKGSIQNSSKSSKTNLAKENLDFNSRGLYD